MKEWRIHGDCVALLANGTVFHREAPRGRWHPGWGKYQTWTLVDDGARAYSEWYAICNGRRRSSRKV